MDALVTPFRNSLGEKLTIEITTGRAFDEIVNRVRSSDNKVSMQPIGRTVRDLEKTLKRKRVSTGANAAKTLPDKAKAAN